MRVRGSDALLALVAALAVAPGCSNGGSDGSHQGRQATQDEASRGAAVKEAPVERSPTRPPLGVVSRLDGSSTVLARLDPRSLEPLAGRLQLGEYRDTWSFSPDRSHVALGMGGVGRICGAGICIVDVKRMQVENSVRAPIAAEAVAWLSPRRVVAVLQSGTVIVTDPVTGKILRRRRLGVGQQLSPPIARMNNRLVFLASSATGPLHLAVADSEGRLRATPLRRIRLAATSLPERAGLAVDPRRRRALVFAAGAPVAEVSLRTMQVRYHRVAMPAADAPAGKTRSSLRTALWLGGGLVAVVGEDVVTDPEGSARSVQRFPAGAQLIDTRRWTARALLRRASHARFAAGRLLVYARGPSARRSAGVGLNIYTRDGRGLLRHLFDDQALEIQIDGDEAYARSRRALRIVRVRSGQVLGEFALPPPTNEVQFLSSPLGSGGS